jgi:NAD-dependent dihydropyrimidine dehydrogenase PreA subunit
MGMFIQIDITRGVPPHTGAEIAAICPVDIFTLQEGILRVLADREDECTLCELCLDLAPVGSITISKTYSGGKLVSRRPSTGCEGKV